MSPGRTTSPGRTVSRGRAGGRRLIVGCGYLGVRIARIWKAQGRPVSAVVLTEEQAARLREEAITAITADVTQPDTLAALPEAEAVLYCVGRSRHTDASAEQIYADGLQNVLDRANKGTGLICRNGPKGASHKSDRSPFSPRILLVSTTGVYGSTDGGRVDEDSPCRPTRESAQAMLEAERRLAAHPLGARSVVLRMAGVYGADRLPRSDDIRAGRPVAVPSGGHLNLIHIDDAAAAVVAADAQAAAEQIPLPRTYCVSDGSLMPRREFYKRLARSLGAAPPQFVEPAAEEPAAVRATDDKRVDNRRMLRELGMRLKFASAAEFFEELGTGGWEPAT